MPVTTRPGGHASLWESILALRFARFACLARFYSALSWASFLSSAAQRAAISGLAPRASASSPGTT